MDEMELTQDQEYYEQLLVVYNGSRPYSRTDILELHTADIGRDSPDYPFKQLLETMIDNLDLQDHGPWRHSQGGRQKWDLRAVGRLIDELRRQPRTSAIKVLKRGQREGEAEKVLVRSTVPSSFMPHADGFWQHGEDLSNGDILIEIDPPKAVFDLDRGQLGPTDPGMSAVVPYKIKTEPAANHEPPGGWPAIPRIVVTRPAANHEPPPPPIPTHQSETRLDIPAYCPFAPAESNGSSLNGLDSDMQKMAFDETQEMYDEQDPRFDGLWNN